MVELERTPRASALPTDNSVSRATHRAVGEPPIVKAANANVGQSSFGLTDASLTESLDWFDATHAGTTAAGEVIKRERGYFSTNAARMQYPSFRERHLPIGSGAVEASAKHLVQQRMKRAGSRWSDLGARAILDLRCHLLSGRSLDCVA